MPAPWPAALPFSVTSALASSISCETRRLVCSESWRIRSAIDASDAGAAAPVWAEWFSAIGSPSVRGRVVGDEDGGAGGGGQRERQAQPGAGRALLPALLLLGGLA